MTLSAPAGRIIALYGAFNEILHDMGLEECIIARTKADKLPASILDKPSIGTHMRPNVELVVGLQPDLVLQLGGRRKAMETVSTLERFGVPVAFFKAATFEELFSVVQRIGVLTGAQQASEKLVSRMKGSLAAIRRSVAQRPRPGVFFEVRYPNLLAAGQDSIITDIIEHAGGVNVLTTHKKLVRLNEEELMRLAPDVYVLQQGAMNPAPSDPAQRQHFVLLPAIRTKRVLKVEEALFSRPGPRSVIAVEELARFLHPEAFGMPQ